MKLNEFVNFLEEHPIKFLLTLFLFHLTVSGMMYAIACSSYLTSMHNGHGLWRFAQDSTLYHDVATNQALLLKSGGILDWMNAKPIWPHAKIISLVYYIWGPTPIAFSPVNALVWIATVLCVYKLAIMFMPKNRNLAILGTMLIILMPTYLLQTTQLLKDPLFILGGGLWFLGLGRLLNGWSKWSSSALLLIGLELCLALRPYWLPVLTLLTLIILIVVFIRIPATRQLSTSTVIVLLLLLYGNPFNVYNPYKIQLSAVDSTVADSTVADSTVADSTVADSTAVVLDEQKKTIRNGYFRYITKVLNMITGQMQTKRGSFNTYIAGSKVDTDMHLNSWRDSLRYIPRALQIGFLAPFPTDWLKPALSAGKGARLLAGLEMSLLYILIIGFFVFSFSNTTLLRVRICLLLCSVSFIMLLGFNVPNVGAIYRMRYAYLLPVILGGVKGWGLTFRLIKK